MEKKIIRRLLKTSKMRRPDGLSSKDVHGIEKKRNKYDIEKLKNEETDIWKKIIVARKGREQIKKLRKSIIKYCFISSMNLSGGLWLKIETHIYVTVMYFRTYMEKYIIHNATFILLSHDPCIRTRVNYDLYLNTRNLSVPNNYILLFDSRNYSHCPSLVSLKSVAA